MATVTANNNLAITFQELLTYGGVQTSTLPVPMVLRSIFNVSGALADQCNKLYMARLTFVTSTPQTLDLNALTDAVTGAAISFGLVRVLAIRVNSTTDGQKLLAGNSGTNEWNAIISNGGTIAVYASSLVNDGFVIFQIPGTTGAVVDGTHKTLKLDPGANAFTADVLIAGA